jgi:hypothetical protein
MSNLHRGHSIDDCYQVSVVAMFVNWSGRNEQSSFIRLSGFRGEDLKKTANQTQELPVAAMFGNRS